MLDMITKSDFKEQMITIRRNRRIKKKLTLPKKKYCSESAIHDIKHISEIDRMLNYIEDTNV